MRLRKKPWVWDALDEFSDFVYKTPPKDIGGRWNEIFGRKAALHIEIGTGRGRFITGMAARFPNINYIGMEAEQDVAYSAAKLMREMAITNAKLLVFDAAGILGIFAPGEVERIYINFCDPWPKHRHAKRRLTHKLFLDKYKIILAKGGELHFKTDNAKLFEYSLNQFADENLKMRNITFDLAAGKQAQENVQTEYEIKFSEAGQKIYRCEVIFP